jgi:cell division protein FtsQ
MSKRGTAVLDTPEPGYAPESRSTHRTSTKLDSRLRRDSVEDFADSYSEDETDRPRNSRTSAPRSQLKLRFSNRIPKTLVGRIATGSALLLIVGAVVGLLMVARSFLLHDPRFMIQSTAAIEIQGNKHLTRAQLLDIFGEDLERNIFRISLDDRQAELEALPWVQRATVMRLLPGRIRLAIVERTPIAFVRQGGHIGLVDAHGVLLDMAAGSGAEKQYSFPVVTGISAADPASTRTARMRIFERFTSDLDGSGEKISENLSEVDLSNPEDVKALIPDHATDVLVHFGDDHFLDRYRKFQELLPQWHTQYPNLASVDMRYEREVVLDMAKPAKGDASAAGAEKAAVAKPAPAAKPASAIANPVVAHPKVAVHARATKSVKIPAHAVAKPLAAARTVHRPAADVASSKVVTDKPAAVLHPATVTPTVVGTTPSASAAARSGYPENHVAKAPAKTSKAPARTSPGKPSAGKPLVPAVGSHTPQVTTQ